MKFNCREILYSTFEYSKDEFVKLNIAEEIGIWAQALESESFARPILLGSPLDDDDGNMDLEVSADGEVDDSKVYVVMYYTYEDAIYELSDSVDSTWTVHCDPVLYILDIECAMKYVTHDGEIEYFECVSSTDRTETMLVVFEGSEKILEGSFDELLKTNS